MSTQWYVMSNGLVLGDAVSPDYAEPDIEIGPNDVWVREEMVPLAALERYQSHADELAFASTQTAAKQLLAEVGGTSITYNAGRRGWIVRGAR